jgi:eukaryotic-like serine/threonine-protein kinase
MGGQSAKLKIACPGCRQKLDVTDVAPFLRIQCPRCGGDIIRPKPFGKLLLEEALGERRGVSAYRALDLTLDREVLVKILDHDIDRVGAGFQALARKAAAVNHPGVVPIYSCGAEQGVPYLVTEFMAGGTLAQRLDGYVASPEAVRQALPWCRSVAGGLQAAAAQGVVHGALTPLSILLDADGRAKLSDFGFEVLLAGVPGRATPYGAGVAAYLSPEVLQGAVPTTASDLFGLGAVLYHVLGGRCPCGTVATDEAAKAFWQEGRGPPPPCTVNPGIAPELSDLCVRLLDPDPGRRPTDVGSVAQSLAVACQALAGPRPAPSERTPHPLRVTVPRSPPGLRPSAAPPPPVSQATAPHTATAPSGPQRDRWMNLLISACIVVALVLGMILYVRTIGYPSWVAPVRAPPTAPAPAAPAQEPAATPAAVPPSVPAAEPAAAPDGMPSAIAPAADPSEFLPDLLAAPTPGPAAAEPRTTSPPDNEPAQVAVPASGSAEARGRHAAGRPRPAGLDFLAAKLELTRYLRALPPEVLAAERERIGLIGDTRGYLVRLMKYLPYLHGKESDVRLHSGAPLRGAVPYCNDSHVAVRVRGDNALHLVPWRDLAIEQVVAFVDFYIQVRLDQGQATTGTGGDAWRREVAEDCLRVAVLCDWYGRPQQALRYARQAVATDPAGASRVKHLFPGLDL